MKPLEVAAWIGLAALLYSILWACFTPMHYDGHLLIIVGLYGAAVGAHVRKRRRA